MKCKKCQGSGLFIDGSGVTHGDCFECRGSGEVDPNAYTTTPAAESKHPAMRDQPEWTYDGKPLPQYPSDCNCGLCRKYDSWKQEERKRLGR